jgi:adenylate cyclase
MMALVDRALALNPSFAYGWYASGVLRAWAGEPNFAIEHLKTSLRLSPREHMGQPLHLIGMAYFFKRRFDEAAAKLLLSIQDQPGFPPAYRALAACYAHMGRLDEARAIVARLRAITPLVMPSDVPWRRPEDHEVRLDFGEPAFVPGQFFRCGTRFLLRRTGGNERVVGLREHYSHFRAPPSL